MNVARGFPIVCVGGSAGGLDAYTRLLRYLPADIRLADEATVVILDILDLPNQSIQNLEVMLGLRSARYYLNIASNAKRGRHPVLHWATTKYAGLDSCDALAVAEALREVEWRGAADERARRRLVLREALRKREELDFTVLDFIGGMPGLNGPGANDWLKCSDQAITAWRDSMVMAPESSDSAVSFGSPDFGAIDSLISLKKAIRKSDLSLEAQRLIYTRIQGYGREEAPTALHVSSNQASAAWRELSRSKERFRKSMLGEPKKCPDIRR